MHWDGKNSYIAESNEICKIKLKLSMMKQLKFLYRENGKKNKLGHNIVN